MPDRGRDPRDPYVRSRPSPYHRQSYDSAYSSRDQLSRISSDDSLSSRSPSPRRRSRSRGHHRRRRRYSYSRSRSRSLSPPGPYPQDDILMPLEPKPWFKKKTLWATLASAATIVAVLPTWKSAMASSASAKAAGRSADASHRAADASTRSADAAERAADASLRSARAVERSTKAVERSANAVVNTAVASGHQDHHGRYCGPVPGFKKMEEEAKGGGGGDGGRGRPGIGSPKQMKRLEYDPLRNILQSANVPAGLAGLPVKAG